MQGTIEKEGTPDLDPQVEAQRQRRREQLQTESAERWVKRKRRRRTRRWAGMPADPPGPPRFPSETTLDEAKAFLSLDNNLYRQARVQFQCICEQEGIVKKTSAGSEKWQAAKDRLIQEDSHLRTVFFDDVSKLDQKYLSLDVLCTDVTKRMRTAKRKISLADAKNIIGINPDESRQVRKTFYDILKADHFTSKLETGDEHWSNLKQQWIDKSAIIRHMLARGAEDPDFENKRKALDVICRDAMKRLRDDQNTKYPPRKKQTHHGQSPGPAPSKPRQTSVRMASTMAETSQLARSVAQMLPPDLQIDPSLLLAASDPSVTADFQAREALKYPNGICQNSLHRPEEGPVPVYFRLNPFSQTQHL